MPQLRIRWHGDAADLPMIGQFMLSEGRPRGGYLIVGIKNLGKRGGLGRPTFRQLLIEVERVSVDQARGGDCCWLFKWDSRAPRKRRLAA